jgi:hypothetical protein
MYKHNGNGKSQNKRSKMKCLAKYGSKAMYMRSLKKKWDKSM